MYLTRIKLFVLGALLLAFVGSAAVSQDFGRGGKGGGKGKGMDPEVMFKMYSGGKDVIVINEVTVPETMSRWQTTEQLREKMSTYLQKKGITNGRMTLEQYKDYSEETRREWMEKMQKGGGFPKPGGSDSTKSGDPKDSTEKTSPSPEEQESRARAFFKQLDKDGDGFLTAEEMQAAGRLGQGIYDAREQYDKDKDGKISADEYVEYFKARTASRGDWGKGKDGKDGDKNDKGGARIEEEDDRPKQPVEEKRVVYRVGAYPPELKAAAPWFEECDRDKDGQVGLYEWKAAGRSVDEFLAMDANGDGFLTVEEILRYRKAVDGKKDLGRSAVVYLPPNSTQGGMPALPWGGGTGGGKGKGGKGGGMNWPNFGGGDNKGGDTQFRMKGKGKGKGGNFGGK